MQPKFILDDTLGRLSRWLRLLGYDASYMRRITQKELINLARQEDRILLTRNHKLAKNYIVPTLLIRYEDIDRQLQQVIEWYNLSCSHIFSRCIICNIPLVVVKKEFVKDKVPQKVYDLWETFWSCLQCGKVYWEGSHTKHIRNKITKIYTKK